MSEKDLGHSCISFAVSVNSVMLLYPSAHCSIIYTLLCQFSILLYNNLCWYLVVVSTVGMLYTMFQKGVYHT